MKSRKKQSVHNSLDDGYHNDRSLIGNASLGNQAKLETMRALLQPPQQNAVAWTGNNATREDGSTCSSSQIEVPDCAEDANIMDAEKEQLPIVQKAVEGARRLGILAQRHIFSDEVFQSDLFARWFCPSDEPLSQEAVVEARTVLGKTVTNLNGPIPLEVDSMMNPMNPDAVAYVYGGRVEWADESIRAASNIHLTSKFFKQTPTYQAGAIFHECTHKYAGTNDHVYAFEGLKTTQEKALDNADSYTWFAQEAMDGFTKAANEEERECLKNLVLQYIDDIIDMVHQGKYKPYDSITLPDGTFIEEGNLVVYILGPQYVEKYPSACEELKEAYIQITESPDGDTDVIIENRFVAKDGHVIPQSMMGVLADVLHLWDYG